MSPMHGADVGDKDLLLTVSLRLSRVARSAYFGLRVCREFGMVSGHYS